MGMTTTTTKFIDMTDADLRAAYVGWRSALYSWSNIGSHPAARGKGRAAQGTGRALRNVEMIEAIARRRQISLAVK